MSDLATTGYSFALILDDGEPADPPAFLTVLPGWEVGDTFLAGEELTRFRICWIGAPHRKEGRQLFDAVWVVKPL